MKFSFLAPSFKHPLTRLYPALLIFRCGISFHSSSGLIWLLHRLSRATRSSMSRPQTFHVTLKQLYDNYHGRYVVHQLTFTL